MAATLRGSILLPVVLLCTLGLTCRWAFVASPIVGPTPVAQVAPKVLTNQQATQHNAAMPVAGLAVGVASCIGVLSMARRSQQSRIAARVASGAPSLIQVLEQKGLLSFAERSSLLSKAEGAGLGLNTLAGLEKLGLLKLVEERGLLSFAETLVTDGKTPILLLLGSAALGVAAYTGATSAGTSFLTWVLVGALGTPALILFGAALVIFFLASGTRRTANLDLTEKVLAWKGNEFGLTEQTRSTSLIESIEDKQLLSFLEANGLISLLADISPQKPLTLTENLKILSQIEQKGLLTFAESTITDTWGPTRVAAAGLVAVPAALLCLLAVPGPLGVLAALVIGLPGLVVLGGGLVLGSLQAKRQTQY